MNYIQKEAMRDFLIDNQELLNSSKKEKWLDLIKIAYDQHKFEPAALKNILQNNNLLSENDLKNISEYEGEISYNFYYLMTSMVSFLSPTAYKNMLTFSLSEFSDLIRERIMNFTPDDNFNELEKIQIAAYYYDLHNN